MFGDCATCCWLVRRSLVCSDQDPGGLLLLPEKGVSANFDISEVLSVMDTLLLVAAREVTVCALPLSTSWLRFSYASEHKLCARDVC